jgi:hypothetical protein
MSGSRWWNGRLIGAGLLVLVVALGLTIGEGLLMMAYEDQAGEQAWLPNDMARWRASLSPGMRLAYWGTSVGAPLAWLAGVVTLALGLWRTYRRPR